MNKRIKNLRKALNLTQQEFADRLNIGRGTLANYEVGRNEPIDAVVSLICHEFGVNENWLRTGDGSMFKKETNTAIEELAAEFYLDSFDEALIQEYVVLAPNQKKMFRTFFYRVLMKSIGESTPEELLKTETGYPSAEEAEIILKQVEKGIVQQYLSQKHQQGNVEMGVEAELSFSATSKDIPATTTTSPPVPDLAAKVAELERQNQELAAEIKDQKRRMDAAKEIEPDMQVLDGEELTTEEAEALYRSSSGYVANADLSALNTTDDTGSGGTKLA